MIGQLTEDGRIESVLIIEDSIFQLFQLDLAHLGVLYQVDSLTDILGCLFLQVVFPPRVEVYSHLVLTVEHAEFSLWSELFIFDFPVLLSYSHHNGLQLRLQAEN